MQHPAEALDVQRELNKLEEMILDSPRLPFSGRTLVDEEHILDQVDLIRLSLPAAFHEAEEMVRRKDELLSQAEHYAQERIDQAERQAAQILDEIGIIQQAEQEARQIRQRVQQECEAAQTHTMAEIERMHRQAQQELEEMRRLAISECHDIQHEADVYADRVLKSMEQQLGEMMRVIRNGRQQLQPEPPPSRREQREDGTTTNPGRPTPPAVHTQTQTRMPERIKG
ncbi:hypothetical protein DO97_11895 [Neosynechococcus sphagnicola sy1]|uniref:ATP synthase F0 subunit B n=1 Tax=Neosynechococcus sphagnicola sy1 TaxID=1497020 RepID=A0A098TJW2_9CYAN|nr:hypothetical protein DO97_11895 [Neosynechococcus sphagnicola sy1]